MKKIVVTGGAGFIGSNFVRMLLRRRSAAKIVVLDKLTYAGNLENLAGLKREKRFKFVKGDICNAKLLADILPGADIIYNFAAETHVDRSILEAGSFVRTDVVGTYTLLQKTLEFKVPRFVQISTDEVYGSVLKGSFRETDPIRPNSPYSASKAGADMLVRAFYKTYGLPALITRSSNNYGPYQHPEKFVPLFTTNAIDGMPLPLYGDGKNVRDWIYVEDNCRAIDLVFERGVPGEVYNIGGDAERENIEIVKLILEILDKPESLIEHVEDRPGHDRRYAMDSTKLQTELGWKPTVDFDDGLRRTVQWYLDNRAWWEKIITGEYLEMYDRIYGSR